MISKNCHGYCYLINEFVGGEGMAWDELENFLPENLKKS